MRASDIPVLDLESLDVSKADSSPAYLKISREIEAAISEDKAEVIVLGCAGMAGLPELLSEKFSVPVIDGVTAVSYTHLTLPTICSV